MHFVVNLLICVVLFSVDKVQSRKPNLPLETTILNSILKNYNTKIRPAGDNSSSPVIVKVNMFVRKISKIDENDMTFEAQLTFRQSWVDKRLQFDDRGFEYINLIEAGHIWIPDLFFSNEISAHTHDLITPNTLTRIYPDGKVLFSTRVSLKLSCPMDLKNYPLDNQVCSIITASYAYTTDDVVILWKEDKPVQITKIMHLPHFTFTSFLTDYCNSKTNTGEYSCIKVDLLLSREFHYYFLNIYAPTAFLVLLSWAVFWINPKLRSLRLGLSISVLISVVFLVNFINSRNPVASYTKAVDVWTGFCISFIFCALIEACFAIQAVTELEEDSLVKMDLNEGNLKHVRSYSSVPLKWLNKYTSKAKRMDVVSRILFPISFCFFIFIYWLTYSK